MLNKINVFLFVIISFFLISCDINPLVGVGNTVDTVAPEIIKVTPTDCSYVREDFDFIVICYDNLLVTKIKLDVEKDGEKIFTKTEKVNSEKNTGYQTWKCPISLEKDLKISSDTLEGEFKFIVYVYDEKGNISEKSYKSVTIVADLDRASADIYFPDLFKKTKCESLRNEEINAENFTNFQNSIFFMAGECDDNFSNIHSVFLTLKNEDGKIVHVSKLDELFEANSNRVSGSLYNWKLTYSTDELNSNIMKSLGMTSLIDTYFFEVFLQVEDCAGNLTFTEDNGYEESLGKSFGWLAIRQVADYPFSDFSSINDKVSVNSTLTGKSYDDDGIKNINIYRKSSDSEVWELIKSYSMNGLEADESLNGTPQIFTWTIPSPEISASSSYEIKVEVIDVNGKSNLDEDGNIWEFLSKDKVFCSFGLVDPAAPNIDPIDLTAVKDIVDKNGDFVIQVKANDNSIIKKVYLAWNKNRKNTVREWQMFADKNKKEYLSENGVKYWDLSPNIPAKEVDVSLTLNIYEDFEDIYDKKEFYIYAEDDSGKYTEITSSMPKITEMPEIKFLSPLSGAVETTYNNQTFNINLEILSYIKKLESVEISGTDLTSKEIDFSNEAPVYDDVLQCWKYTCSIPSTQWWQSNAGEGEHSLTAVVRDVFSNMNVDTLSFEIDNGVPKIKSVSAETEPGNYCAGSVIDILVELKKAVHIEATKDNLTLILNNGGVAYFNKEATEKTLEKDRTKKIYFTYTVDKSDSSEVLDAVTLSLKGAEIWDEVGNIAGLGDVTGSALSGEIEISKSISIEKNSSSMLMIDNIPPKITKVTSITPNGSYTKGDQINIIAEFDENIEISGAPILYLNKNYEAVNVKRENGNQLYFTYTAGSENIDLLEWTKITVGTDGIIKDCAINNQDSSASGNEVDFSTLIFSEDISLKKSGQIIKIDNTAPQMNNKNFSYTNESLVFELIFDEPVHKVAGKKAVLHRKSTAVPIVLSVDKYNEYVALVPKIGSYYEEGVNGASSSFKIDNTTKYILKYEYDETNPELLELFKTESLGFYRQEIMMESNWVESKDNSIIITIPKENLLTGEYYKLDIEAGFAEDKVGIPYNMKFESTDYIQAGTKAQPPVIRIKKITGGDAQTTAMKINTITKDASIKYNTSGNTPDTSYATEVELGRADYNNATYKITALAQIGTNTESDCGYEVAYKTVIYTSHGVKTSGDEVYFRGSNVDSGTATVPNFPFSWDEASSPLLWADRGTAADVGMIKATKFGSNYYVVSWGVTDTLYFRPLSCKKETNTGTGRLIWAWGQGGSAEVSPGGSSDSKRKYDANNNYNIYEEYYHDRFGNNYKYD